MRIVNYSSLKFQGLSPNDVWVKGPNTLNDMFGIMLRFRTHKHALIGDIKKMYTQIHTTITEKHMRRVLWRFLKTDEGFKTYGVNRVMFGDRPAAAILLLGFVKQQKFIRTLTKTLLTKSKMTLMSMT